MDAELESVEVEPVGAGDDDLAVEYAALRQVREERGLDLREVAVEALGVAALEEEFVAVAEDEGAEAVPFGLEDPVRIFRDGVDTLGEHRQNGWHHRQVHDPILY